MKTKITLALVFLILLVLMVGLVACGGDGGNSTPVVYPTTVDTPTPWPTDDPSCHWEESGTPDDYFDDVWVCGTSTPTPTSTPENE